MAPAESVTGPLLLLLNGAPAAGKSSIARRYVDDRPLRLALDIDVLRGLIGRWRDDATASGAAARELALSMAGTHLAAGYDVVVPQQVVRIEFADRLERLATDVDARWWHVVLTADPDELVARFGRRSRVGSAAEHLDAQHLVDAAGGPPVIRRVDAELRELALTHGLPLIDTTGRTVSQVFGRLLAALG